MTTTAPPGAGTTRPAPVATDPFRHRRTKFPSLAGLVTGYGWILAGVGLLLAAAVEAAVDGPDRLPLALCGAGTLAAGGALLALTRQPDRMSLASVFAAVGAGWVAFSLAAAVPFLVTGASANVLDAVFTAVAGVTTTATTLVPVEETSRGILAWRAILQWLGGAFALSMALSVLPFLGTGEGGLGHQPPAYRSDRFLSRVGDTLGPVMAFYVAFTAVTALAYRLAGMGTFDAAAHALTTTSTGGMSTREASIAAFDSAAVETVAIVAMLVAGGSVALYLKALRGRPGPLLHSIEVRAYLAVVVVGTLVAAQATATEGVAAITTIRRAAFAVVSFATTTGYRLDDVSAWDPGAQGVLLVIMGVGAMAGSPAGGFKLLRLLALVGYIRREITRQLHSASVAVVRVGSTVVGEDLLRRLVGYQAVFSVVAAVGAMGVAVAGVDVYGAVAASVSAITNTGVVLGSGPSDLGQLDASARALMIPVMLAGRVEIYPLLVGGGAVIDWLAPNRRRRFLVNRLVRHR